MHLYAVFFVVFFLLYGTWAKMRQDHVDIIYKRIHFHSDFQPSELAICAIICMYAMSQPSQRIFRDALSTSATLKTAISHKVKRRY